MIFKQLPTMISDLNKLGIALKSLDVMKIGTVGVNAANIEAYRTALKGLSVEQSVFALASKGATEEQIRQILVTNQATASEVEATMAKAGLTTATKALTQAEMVEMATKNGVAKAEAEALLSKIGITATEEGQVVVKKQVTLAMLEQAVASGTLTKAEASQIATMLGLNAVETANIGITNVLTASFTKLWAVITAHPIGAILTAIGAVAVGTIAYINKVNKDAEKALVEAHENAEKALEDTKTSLSDDKSELQSINSELEQTKDKIREISSIGAPTLTEQNELDKLSTANAQLEIQKSLLENNIKLKQKSAALDAKELLGTQVEMEYSSILDNSSITSSTESYSYADHAKYQASNLKNAYNIYMKALEEGNVRRQELAQELIDASAGDTAELTSKLLEIVESFKYDDGTIIDGYEDIYNEYMGMIYNLQSLTNPDTFLDIAKSITVGTGVDYEKAISEAYALAYEGNFDVDNLNQDFVKALADAGIDESTINYIFSLKQKEYQLLVDKINNKYKVSEVPDKIKQDYWDANGNIHSEYVDVDEETKNRIEEINTINQSLNDYAKENPVEFQLVTSYDEGFTLLDKYIEEEKNKAEKNTDYVGDYITNAIARIYDEAKVQSSTLNNKTDIFSSFANTDFGERIQHITDLFNEGSLTHKQYFDALQSEIDNFDASNFTDSIEDMNKASEQFFVSSVQQTASGLSDLINSFDSGEMSVSEYLEGYLAIGNTLSTLADDLQENSAAWNENGEAISNAENAALDETQAKLANAIATIQSYQDSIYSIEQIMSNSVAVGSEEFSAHAQIIAQDLYSIVQTGGLMADEIKARLGSTTSEIAQSLTENVANQELACEAIMNNTNNAITNMATAIGDLFDTLGSAISNFKVDISFGIKSIDWKKVNILGKDINLPEINFELGASGESLKSIGDAVSSFGKTIASNISAQTLDMNKFHFGSTDAAKDRNYTPSSGITKNYEDAMDNIKDSTKSATDSAEEEFEELFNFFERRVTVLDNALSLLNANLENVTGSFAKNQLLNAEQNLNAEKINNYTDALAMYTQKANEALAKLPTDIAEKIQNGAVDLTTFIGDGNKEVVEAIKDYQDWADKVSDCKQQLAELKEEIRQLELEKFNNIVDDFTNQFDIRDDSISLIDKQIALLEEAGQLIGSSFYTTQIDQSKKQLATLEEEKTKLVEQLNAALSSGRVNLCPTPQ